MRVEGEEKAQFGVPKLILRGWKEEEAAARKCMHNSCSKTFRDVYWKHRCWNSFKSFSVSFERLTCKYTIFQSFPYDNYVYLPLIKPMSKMLCQKLYLTLPDLWVSITMIHKMYNIEVDFHFSRMADRGGTAPTKTGSTTPSPPS